MMLGARPDPELSLVFVSLCLESLAPRRWESDPLCGNGKALCSKAEFCAAAWVSDPVCGKGSVKSQRLLQGRSERQKP